MRHLLYVRIDICPSRSRDIDSSKDRTRFCGNSRCVLNCSTATRYDPFLPNVAAGLNWVRIPIGFWAIETMGDEPFLAGTSWRYFLKA